MIVKRGDVVMSDFGVGKVVAITKDWVIHETQYGDEVAINRKNDWVCVPAELPKQDVDDTVTLEAPKEVDDA